MSSTMIFVGLPEDSKSSITNRTTSETKSGVDALVSVVQLENSAVNTQDCRVPNAPKSCIAEIFSSDSTDRGSPMKNGSSRPRVVRDTPTRPRDTHSRLFGQGVSPSVVPMVTDTIRSNIQFGNSQNGSPAHSPKPLTNGNSPSRVSYTPPRRNPVTGDGVVVLPPRRAHPAATLREGNPITGDGYKSMNGQINMVTSVNGRSSILHNRVPPGGYSSGLW